MSLSPMLQDEEEGGDGTLQIRSHSGIPRSILGPRHLNEESAAGTALPVIMGPMLEGKTVSSYFSLLELNLSWHTSVRDCLALCRAIRLSWQVCPDARSHLSVDRARKGHTCMLIQSARHWSCACHKRQTFTVETYKERAVSPCLSTTNVRLLKLLPCSCQGSAHSCQTTPSGAPGLVVCYSWQRETVAPAG